MLRIALLTATQCTECMQQGTQVTWVWHSCAVPSPDRKSRNLRQAALEGNGGGGSRRGDRDRECEMGQPNTDFEHDSGNENESRDWPGIPKYLYLFTDMSIDISEYLPSIHEIWWWKVMMKLPFLSKRGVFRYHLRNLSKDIYNKYQWTRWIWWQRSKFWWMKMWRHLCRSHKTTMYPWLDLCVFSRSKFWWMKIFFEIFINLCEYI